MNKILGLINRVAAIIELKCNRNKCKSFRFLVGSMIRLCSKLIQEPFLKKEEN